MEVLLGIVVLLLLMGVGSRKWRHDVREALDERRERKRLRREYDF